MPWGMDASGGPIAPKVAGSRIGPLPSGLRTGPHESPER
jgi:hypothetical protein